MAYSAISAFDVDEKFVDRSNLVAFFANMDLWISKNNSAILCAQAIDHCMLGFEDLFAGKFENNTDLNIIFSKFNRTIEILCYKREWNTLVKMRTFELLRLVIKTIVFHHSKLPLNTFLLALSRIFTQRCNFYDLLQDSEIQLELKKLESQGCEFIKGNFNRRDLGDMFVLLLQYFGECGGFSALLEIVANPAISMREMKDFLRLLTYFLDQVNVPFLKVWAMDVKKYVFDRCLVIIVGKMTAEEQEDFGKVGSLVQKGLLGVVYPADFIAKEVESFNMQYSALCLHQDNLVIRLKGLQYLKKSIDKTVKREEAWSLSTGIGNFISSKIHQEAQPKAQSDSYLDPLVLLGVIEQHKVIERYFEIVTSHVEIVKQGLPFIQFLNGLGMLKTAHLDLIWESSIGIHEHDKKIIFQTFGNLVRVINTEFVLHLLGKISAMPLHDIDFYVLDLIVEIERVLLKSQNKEKHTGLEILWRIIFAKDEAGVEAEVKNKTAMNLADILSSSQDCEAVRDEYLLKCIPLFSQDIFAMITLRYILETIQGGKKKSKADIVNELIKKHNLIEVYFENFYRYKKEIAQRVKKDTDVDQFKIRNNGFSHTQHVEMRLGFLEFILLNSSFTLSTELVDKIWDLLIANALSPKEKEITFVWLANRVTQSSSVDNYIYNKILSLDCSKFSYQGFTMFVLFFIQINEKEKLIALVPGLDETQDYCKYAALSVDLRGLNNVWDVALTCADDSVAHEAQKMLNMLFHNVDPYFEKDGKKKALKMREDYIESCVAKLQGFVKSKSRLQMVRLISLIKNYIEEYDNEVVRKAERERKAQSKTSKFHASQVNIQNIIYNKFPTKRGTFQSTMTVEEFKQRILSGFREELDMKPNEKLRLFWSTSSQSVKDCELKCDSKTLESYGLSSVDTSKEGEIVVTVKKIDIYDNFPSYSVQLMRSLQFAFSGLGLEKSEYVSTMDKFEETITEKPNSKMKEIGWMKSVTGKFPVKVQAAANEEVKTANAVSVILANNFVHFYQLLDFGDEVASEVMDLICLFPIPKEMMNNFNGISENKPVAWDAVLDSTNLYKLVYNLHSLEEMMFVGPTAQRDEWVKKIAGKNLFSFLTNFLSTLPEFNAATTPAIEKKLLKHLFRLMGRLVTCETEVPNKQLLPNLVKRLLQMTYDCANQEDVSTADSAIVVEAFSLFSCLLAYDQSLYSIFVKFPLLKEWFLVCTLKAKQVTIRESAATHLNSIIIKGSTVKVDDEFVPKLLLNLVVPFIYGAEKYSNSAEQFFRIVATLLQVADQSVDFVNLLLKLSRFLTKHQGTEFSSEEGPEDKILIGILASLRAIIKRDLSLRHRCYDLVGEVFTNCLFAFPSFGDSALPKCKQEKSRLAALKLLIELVKGDEDNFTHVLSLLSVQLQYVNLKENYYYSPLRRERSRFGYLGLENLGATCYMNSLLQQLFMIPLLRARVLSYDFTDREDPESLVTQFQILMASLQESQSRHYDTRAFCKRYKVDGQPINPGVQADAWEFLNNLFNELESKIEKKDQNTKENFIRDIFGGQIANQLIGSSSTCSHTREGAEPFFTISVDIKDKTTLLETLQLFTAGEMINDVYCDQCQGNVNTLKRCVVAQLPPILVIHLKRFEVDYNTMQCNKLNSVCSFPLELDMEPFTKEGIARKEGRETPENKIERPPNYYQYELHGITVHSGSLEVGHYYSYIKERVNSSGAPLQWFEFNDEKVVPFDIKTIPGACYGGTQTCREYSRSTGEYQNVTRDNTRNAYILIYQRKGMNEDIEKYLDPTGSTEFPDVSTEKKKRTHSAGGLRTSKDDTHHHAKSSSGPYTRSDKSEKSGGSHSRSHGHHSHHHSHSTESDAGHSPNPSTASPRPDLLHPSSSLVSGSTGGDERLGEREHRKSSHKSSHSSMSEKSESEVTEKSTKTHKKKGTHLLSSDRTEKSHRKKGMSKSSDETMEVDLNLIEESEQDVQTRFQISKTFLAMNSRASKSSFILEYAKMLSPTNIDSNKDNALKISKGKVFVPAPILSKIYGANINATLLKFVFDLNYLKFAVQIIDNHEAKGEPPSDITKYNQNRLFLKQFAVKFYEQIFSRSRDKPKDTHFQQILIAFFQNDSVSSNWLLRQMAKSQLLRTCLIASEKPLRLTYLGMISAALSSTFEQPLYQATMQRLQSPQPTLSLSVSKNRDSVVIFFIHNLLKMFQDQAIMQTKPSDLFLPLLAFVKKGREEIDFLINHCPTNFFQLAEDLCTKKSAELTYVYDKAYLGPQRFALIHLNTFVDVLAVVMCACFFNRDETSVPLKTVSPRCTVTSLDQLIQIPTELTKMIFPPSAENANAPKGFLYKLLSEQENYTGFDAIVTHTCWENREASAWWLQIVLDGVRDRSRLCHDGFIHLIDALCTIGDSEQEWRIRLTLKYLVKLFKGSELGLLMKRIIHQRMCIMKEVNAKFRDEYNKVDFKSVFDKNASSNMYNSNY